MAHRARLRQHVGVALQFVQAQLLLRGDELLQRELRALRFLRRAVELSPVAGRDDGRLGDAPAGRFRQPLAQPADRHAHFLRDERHPFAHGERRGRVVQSERQKLHGLPAGAPAR